MKRERFIPLHGPQEYLVLLSPTRLNADVANHIFHKVQRWALCISEFNVSIEHIPGEENIWADILTRWAAPGNEISPARRISALRVPLLSSTADASELPFLHIIAELQRLSSPSDPSYTLNDGDPALWVYASEKPFIPPADEDLHLVIFVAPQCSLGGHRGYTSTLNTI